MELGAMILIMIGSFIGGFLFTFLVIGLVFKFSKEDK